MQREAESHADEDKRKRELIDARNKADQIIWTMEKQLKDNADKISEGDKAPIQSAIEEVKKAASGDDVDAINRAIDNLQQRLTRWPSTCTAGRGRVAARPAVRPAAVPDHNKARPAATANPARKT